MSDITYKKFSELTRTYTLQSEDIIPIAQFVSGISYNSRSVPLSTLYNQTSAALIGPFTTSIQSTVNSGLSSDKWNSTYSTVQANSGTWGTVTGGLTIFKEMSSTTSPNASVTVHALSVQSSVADVDVALITKGSGATLAQIPDGSAVGGNKRGSYATDWQKSRNNAQQVASGVFSVIGGGARNTASSDYSVVNGGYTNSTSNTHTVIGGGLLNTLSGDAVYGVIAGGYNNMADRSSTAVGGGESNKALSAYATVPGGYQNVASGNASFAVGSSNIASGNNSSAIGAGNNTNRKVNTHIIGSNITASDINYTYVNNISSQDAVHGANFYGPNIIKAWVNFDGTAGGGAAINSSYNVATVTRNSAGTFTIGINSGVLANANYLVIGGGTGSTDVGVVVAAASEGGSPTLKTTTQCQINIRYYTTDNREPKEVYVMFIGL